MLETEYYPTSQCAGSPTNPAPGDLCVGLAGNTNHAGVAFKGLFDV